MDSSDIFERLAQSKFRSRFHLGAKEIEYIELKGWPVIERHARDFIVTRLAPATPTNDGKQTPMRGHPVFIAQHACACCCRGCLEKWHHIPKNRTLSDAEVDYIVNILVKWIKEEFNNEALH